MVARTSILSFLALAASAFASPQLLQQDGANPYDDAAAIWLPGMTQGSLDQSGSADPTNATTMPTIVADGWSHDGVDDILDFGYAAALEPKTNPFAMSIWFYTTSYPSLYGLMGKSFYGSADRFVMYLDAGAKASGFIQAGASYKVVEKTGLTSNTWHHACMTTIASPPANWAIAFYVDGVLAGTNTLANHDSIDYAGGVNEPYRIGCYNNGSRDPDYFLKGKTDLAAHWNRGLSSNEVRQVYELGRRGLRPIWNVIGGGSLYAYDSYTVFFDKLDSVSKTKVSLYSDAALTNLLAETNVTGNTATLAAEGADMLNAVAVVRPYRAGSDDRPVIAANKLIAWWWPSLDGDYSDRAGNWDGISGGDVGVSTNGWTFTGTSNSYVEVSTNAIFAVAEADGVTRKPISLTMWWKCDGSMAAAQSLFSKCRTGDDSTEGEEYFSVKGDGNWGVATNQITTAVRPSGIATGGQVASGTWHHVAMTFDTTNLIGYFDGKQCAIDSDLSGVTNSFYPLRFGSLRKSGRLVGSIDNVRFYSVAIPSNAVNAIYNLGRTAP